MSKAVQLAELDEAANVAWLRWERLAGVGELSAPLLDTIRSAYHHAFAAGALWETRRALEMIANRPK